MDPDWFPVLVRYFEMKTKDLVVVAAVVVFAIVNVRDFFVFLLAKKLPIRPHHEQN